MVVEPLELEILATLIRDRHETLIADMILEKKPFDRILEKFRPEVLCLTGYITHIPGMIEYCRLAKKMVPGIKTIVGGVHIELYPDDIEDPSVDFRVVRNATRAFPGLMEYIEGRSEIPAGVLRTGEAADRKNLPDFDFYVPLPDRSLTLKYRKSYFYVFHNRVALMKTSFGCPYTCNFCFCREITGRKYYERPLTEVMRELESIAEKEVYIIDDDFLLDPRRVNDFINSLKERNIKKHFLVYGRADFIASHPDIMKSFRQTGLRTVIVGLESFDETELSEFNKKTTESINRQAMEVLNRLQISCYAAIIVSPKWTKEDFNKAGIIMKELKIRFVNLQPLTPLKGTFTGIAETDIILDRRDFARWDLAHVSVRPENMSVADFYREILKLYELLIFSPVNILSHMKYPLPMQLKMARGLFRVHRQYRSRIMEARKNA
jgi:radical SAM superfamily enzyme YgiQ (UPF0313 family)